METAAAIFRKDAFGEISYYRKREKDNAIKNVLEKIEFIYREWDEPFKKNIRSMWKGIEGRCPSPNGVALILS